MSGTPILDDHGSFRGTFGMFMDITERKRAEAEEATAFALPPGKYVAVSVTDQGGHRSGKSEENL